MNYFELKQRIQDYTENTESTFVAEIDDFIRATEERIFEQLELNLFKKTETSALTIGNKFLTLPEKYLNSIFLMVTLDDGREVPLKKKHATFVDDYTRNPTDVGSRDVPKYYADYDAELSTSTSVGSTIQVGPVPDKAYACRLGYYYQPASLTEVTTFRSVTLGASPLLTGSAGSSTITVTDTAHGANEQTLVTLAAAEAVDGIAAAVINTTLPHNIQNVTTNTYDIVVKSNDPAVQSGATTGATAGGGSAVTAKYTNGGTSWIGDNAETAIFYGCMCEAYIFMKEDAGENTLLDKMDERFEKVMARLKVRYQGRGRMEERRYDNARVEPD